MVRVFANGTGKRSIPGQVIPKTKTKKWHLMPPCLTLSITKYGSRVKWSNLGKGVAPSPTPWCSSYYKGNLRVALDYGHQLYLQLQIFRTMKKIWISCVEKALLSDGKNTVQAQQWLNKYYSDSAPLETTVKRRYANFKRGRTDTNDPGRSGCLNSAVVPENTKKIRQIVLADRKLKLREISEELKISEGSVFTILHEHLSMRKLCSKVPHSRSKITTRRRFRALFLTGLMQQKSVFV